MSWHRGICITTKYHSDFVEANELPCNLQDWFENQYEYGGWYDGCEITLSEVDQDKVWNWHSVTTEERLNKFIEMRGDDIEKIIGPNGKEVFSYDDYFIDYDNGEKIEHIAFIFSLHS